MSSSASDASLSSDVETGNDSFITREENTVPVPELVEEAPSGSVQGLADLKEVEDVSSDSADESAVPPVIEEPESEFFASDALFKPVVVGEPTTLHVKVIEATNIPKMDALGSADPYCRLSIKGRPKSEMQKTRTIKQTYTPVWKQDMQFSNVTENDVLVIEMRDWDFGSRNDPISNVEIPLNQYNLRDYPCDGWHQMKKADEKLQKAARIRLMLYLAPAEKAENMNGKDIAYVTYLKRLDQEGIMKEMGDKTESPYLKYVPDPYIYPKKPKGEQEKQKMHRVKSLAKT